MQREQLLTLGDYVGVLRRRRLWIVAVMALGVAAAYGYAAHQTRLYQASAQVTVSNVAPPPGLGGAAAGQQSASSASRYLSDQATLARSPAVAKLALSLAKVPNITVQRLLSETSTTPNSSADVFLVTVKARSPREAATLATAYANAFVSYRRALNSSTFAPLAASLHKQLTRAEAALKSAPPSAHGLLRQQLGGLQRQSASLQAYIALQDRGTSVVASPAAADAQLTQPKTSIDLALGLGGGLIIGILLAFVVDALDARTRSTGQISSALRLPIVGRIPTPARRLRRRNQLVMLEPSSPDADAFRKLAARMMIGASGDERPKIILVTSAVAGEGKTTTACNLAIALAEIESRVVLVDLDLARPSVARFFNAGAARGIRDVVAGDATLAEVRTPVELEPRRLERSVGVDRRLEVVTAGSQLVDPTAAVASPKLEEIFAALAQSADVVIVDTPPVLAVSHATLASRCADAVLAIARVDALTPDVAEEFHEALSAMPAEKLGFVLTRSEKEGRRYGSGYGYGYPQYASALPVVDAGRWPLVLDAELPDIRAHSGPLADHS